MNKISLTPALAYVNFKEAFCLEGPPSLFRSQISETVITGYNTDIEFGGVTYHIQTEDKGLATPVIMSLVYDRGTILASKRQPYEDLIAAGFDEKVLAERLRKQHKTICAAVKKGRIEELKGLSPNGAKKKTKKKASEADSILTIPNTSERDSSSAIVDRYENILDANPTVENPVGRDEDLTPPIPMPEIGIRAKKVTSIAEPVVDGVAVVDIPDELPIEAVRVVSDLAGIERPESTKLNLELLGTDMFRGGTNCTVAVMVCSGSKGKVVEGAEVMVKVLGSSFRPLIFHSRTDKNGISRVALQLPSFNTGRASVLVRAINDGQEVEVRRPVSHS